MKKILLFLLIGVFLISFSSAMEWDNVGSYDKDIKTITIENALGLGSTIGGAQLNTPLNYRVSPGYQKVAEFDLWAYEDYNDVLKNMEFYDKNYAEWDKHKFTRDYDIKYKTTRLVDKPIYNKSCYEDLKNATTICENVITGYGKVEVDEWVNINTTNLIKNDRLTIGIFTNVETGDKVEWILSLYGVRVTEWATWTAALNVGLVSYYKMDDNASNTNVNDSTNTNEGILNGGNNTENASVTGKISTALELDGSNDFINITPMGTFGSNMGTGITFAAWINTTTSVTPTNIMGIVNTGALDTLLTINLNVDAVGAGDVGKISVLLRDEDGNVLDGGTTNDETWRDGAWHFLVVTVDGPNNTIQIVIDNSSAPITYNNQQTPDNFIDFDFDMVLGARNLRGTVQRFYDGTLDEVGIWNRTLSSAEMTQLYNDGNGITWTDFFQNISVVLNDPTNASVINDSTVDFNWTIVPLEQNITNWTLSAWFINGTLALQTSNTTINTNQTTTVIYNATTFISGNYTWNVESCGTSGNCTTSNNWTFELDVTSPQINVTSPTGTLDYNLIGGNETLNVTFTDTNLYSCWYNYNGTNITIDGCLTGVKNSTNFVLESDNLNMTIYANDSQGNLNSTFISWNYKIFETSQTFNNITTEGATETFSINFTKASTLQVSTVSLIYNGTINSFSYSVSGDDVISAGDVTIPVVASDTNVTFFWNITLNDDSSIITASNNQTILSINVDNCSTFTNIIYNFTQYDEETKSMLTGNNSIELQINLYDKRKTTVLSNFSANFTGTNPVQFCIDGSILQTVNYSAYVIVKYWLNSTATNQSYSIEYYNILNDTIGNTTIPKNIALYSLKTDDTTKFRLTFRDSAYSLAPNILVQVYRQYIADNDFKIVEIPITDSNGQTILNLVKDNIVYNFIMVNESGDVVGTFNSIIAFCQDVVIGDCTINLAPDPVSESAYDYNEEFDISISNPSYSNSTKQISINFVTGDLSPKTVRMEVVRNNQFGNRSVCSDSLLAASGVLSCDVSSITDTDQFLFISTFVEDDLAKQDTTNLNSDILNFGTLNGAFYAFLLILFLITMFMEDRKALVVALGLGWVIIISLGLMNGKLIGFTSAGIWILVSIAIFLWKLNEEESL
jgi:hypothetical protein